MNIECLLFVLPRAKRSQYFPKYVCDILKGCWLCGPALKILLSTEVLYFKRGPLKVRISRCGYFLIE